jgi:hypothetical protein
MFIDKNSIKSVEVMTEEERNNPSLIKQRKDYISSPISVYYGSPKDEIKHVCVDCKKKNHCKECLEIEIQDRWLRENANNPFINVGLTSEQKKKMSGNVLVIAKCIFKEEK